MKKVIFIRDNQISHASIWELAKWSGNDYDCDKTE